MFAGSLFFFFVRVCDVYATCAIFLHGRRATTTATTGRLQLTGRTAYDDCHGPAFPSRLFSAPRSSASTGSSAFLPLKEQIVFIAHPSPPPDISICWHCCAVCFAAYKFLIAMQINIFFRAQAHTHTVTCEISLTLRIRPVGRSVIK